MRSGHRPGCRLRRPRSGTQHHPSVEGGQEAGLLVGEVLVERLGGHAGGGTDVVEGGCRVPFGRHRVRDRVDQAVPLYPGDELAGKVVAAARQHPLGVMAGREPGKLVTAGQSILSRTYDGVPLSAGASWAAGTDRRSDRPVDYRGGVLFRSWGGRWTRTWPWVSHGADRRYPGTWW